MGGQQRQQLGVGAVGGGDDRVQQRVVLRPARARRARRPRIAATRSSGCASKARVDRRRGTVELGRIIASASARLGADLVVDRLPADARPGRRAVAIVTAAQPALGGELRPRPSTIRSRMRHAGAALGRRARHRPPVAGSASAVASSSGTKSTFSRTPQSGQHQSSGMSAQAVPAAKPSCSSPAVDLVGVAAAGAAGGQHLAGREPPATRSPVGRRGRAATPAAGTSRGSGRACAG